ncbi:60S ribosome subunit biogenesis protein NIP7 [Penicillium atrosanguineum]|nr:60S ribosome subunit biogenesis protein NIP7 [Penicillium atrosanguineum]
MRQLTEEETKTLFSKLAHYTGRSLNSLVAPTDGGPQMVFRLQGSRVYYMPLAIANLATSIPRDNLLSAGTQMGKFTKTGKFRLNLTCLDVVAPHARYKLWIKANGEMPFLYGGNVVKAHVGRWSEDCPEHSGVIVYNQDDTPLGFGVSARATQEAKKLDPTGIVLFRQADVGEYLREEDTLFTT